MAAKKRSLKNIKKEQVASRGTRVAYISSKIPNKKRLRGNMSDQPPAK